MGMKGLMVCSKFSVYLRVESIWVAKMFTLFLFALGKQVLKRIR